MEDGNNHRRRPEFYTVLSQIFSQILEQRLRHSATQPDATILRLSSSTNTTDKIYHKLYTISRPRQKVAKPCFYTCPPQRLSNGQPPSLQLMTPLHMASTRNSPLSNVLICPTLHSPLFAAKTYVLIQLRNGILPTATLSQTSLPNFGGSDPRAMARVIDHMRVNGRLDCLPTPEKYTRPPGQDLARGIARLSETFSISAMAPIVTRTWR